MKQINSDKYFFVINPNAGNEDGKKEWPNIVELLLEENIYFDFEFTDSTGHAERIVIEKIQEGFKKFIVVGGDGTLNEVVNGIFKQNHTPSSDIYIGIFCMGTGNDWARYYGFSKSHIDAVERLKNGDSKVQDVGKIEYGKGNNPKHAYFINIAGLCYDSVVVHATNEMKERGKRTAMGYLQSLLKSLIHYKPWKLKVFINDEVLEGKFLSISIGIGKFSGGGMIQTPNAVIDDGYFDVTIYPNMSKLKMIFNVRKLYNGKILSIKGVKSFRTKQLNIEAKNATFAQTDGEIIGNAPYEITVIPQSINILI